jgi:hypothetical protein
MNRLALNLITKEEKEEMTYRIISFMESCLIVSRDICEPSKEDYHQERYKHYHYFFEEGNLKSGQSWYYNRIYEKEGNFKISNETLFNDFVGTAGMFDRLKYHIRMNGSEECVMKVIEILGSKVASIYLNQWARKNVAIGIILKKYSDKLNERSYISEFEEISNPIKQNA